jgi:hypothetical protein
MEKQGRSLFVGTLAAVLVAASLGLAADAHKTSDRKTFITFAQDVKLQAGGTLPAGTYEMKVPEGTQNPTVSFLSGDKVVATAPANLVSEQNKNSQTEIDSVTDGNYQDVTAIRPQGWKESLHFSTNP